MYDCLKITQQLLEWCGYLNTSLPDLSTTLLTYGPHYTLHFLCLLLAFMISHLLQIPFSELNCQSCRGQFRSVPWHAGKGSPAHAETTSLFIILGLSGACCGWGNSCPALHLGRNRRKMGKGNVAGTLMSVLAED